MANNELNTITEGQQASSTVESADGPFIAGLLAGGIGSAAMGFVVTLSAASKGVSDLLNWYAPVGPLSGKAGVAIAVWIIAWIALHFALRGKQLRIAPAFAASMLLVALGLAFTFPPIFELFAHG